MSMVRISLLGPPRLDRNGEPVELDTRKTVALVAYLAMTGEITLRGDVLPVGGIKEKVLAAHRAGIGEVMLPHTNEKDLADIPESVRKTMRFKLVRAMSEVLETALEEHSDDQPPALASTDS